MAFTYDPDLESYPLLAKVRLLVGDTNSTYPLFTDNELNGLLTHHSNNLYQTVAWALRALSVDPDRLVEMLEATAGGISMADMMDTFAARADALLADL